MSVRSVRNNNPGNVDAGAHWQGLMSPANMTPEQREEPRFAVFKTPVYGFRALAIVLLNYQRLYALDSIGKIFDRYAPPGENDTRAYKEAVSKQTGVPVDAPINLRTYANLAALEKAIATHEAGGWFFNDQDLHDGAALALDGH